jgi:hypothetical protein
LRHFFDGEGRQTAPGEYQIWQARMRVTSAATPEDLDDWFPIGFVVLHSIRGPGANAVDGVELLLYRIRDYYRQMNLFERMLSTLTKEKAMDVGERRVPLSEEDKKRYSYLFERYGFEVVLKKKEKKQQILQIESSQLYISKARIERHL